MNQATTISQRPGSPAGDPGSVPVTVITDAAQLGPLRSAVRSAVRIAVDTETFGFTDIFEGHIRVLIVATRDDEGAEQCFVVDMRDIDRGPVAEALSGAYCDGWNAHFDARVTDRDIFEPNGVPGIVWYDAMYADAVLFAGVVGFKFYHGLGWASKRYLGIELDGKDSTRTSYDESSDLSDEQIRYAAYDAIVTLWTGDAIRAEVAASGLEQAVAIENAARPFLDKMERFGMPLDFARWHSEVLEPLTAKKAEVLTRIANLTGGGQPNLFTQAEDPTWNVNSGPQLKSQLNKYEKQRIEEFFLARDGRRRLLGAADKVDKGMLGDLGGDLATAVLELRDVDKTLSTYGDNLEEHIRDDGRIHPQYRQIVGTATGRLNSSKPNAQNFTPKLKPFFRPKLDGRVFVYADLSQAELRFLTQESGDEALREAFVSGRDIHEATAERMFSVDMVALKEAEPKEYKALRAKGKTLNFGIVYGLGPAALALQLTRSGVETSTEEAKALLAAYLTAYPKVKRWLEARDAVVQQIVDNPPEVDVDATLELSKLTSGIKSVSNKLKGQFGRRPDAAELAEELAVPTDRIEWAQSFEGPVVLDTSGAPIGFDSRTSSGRRRRFQVAAASWQMSIVTTSIRRRHELTERVRSEFEKANNVRVSDDRGKALDRDDLKEVFKDRDLLRDYFQRMRDALSPAAFGRLARTAVADCVGALGNAYRNAPIQGGVADVALVAYGMIDEQLAARGFLNVWPVQTVHDSIVLECDASDAAEICELLKSAMESAMQTFCPDVPAVADADIRTSLDDDDVIVELGGDSDLSEIRRLVLDTVHDHAELVPA